MTKRGNLMKKMKKNIYKEIGLHKKFLDMSIWWKSTYKLLEYMENKKSLCQFFQQENFGCR